MKINLLANAGKSGDSADDRKRKPSDSSSRRYRPMTFRVESMDHHVSGLSVIGCVLLAISSLACALSLIAPFWLLFPVPAVPVGSGQMRTQANGSTGIKSRATVPPASLLPDLVAAPPPPPPRASTGNSSLRVSAGVSGSGHASAGRGGRRPGATRPPAISDAWSEGLWAKCYLVDHRCEWFWKDNFVVQSSFENWHHATQGLFTAGTLLLLMLFVIVSCNVCCRCCRLSPSFSFVVGSLVIASLILTAAALTVYGGFQSNVQRWTAATNGLAMSTRSRLYWAYYVGVAGTVSALVAASLFFCDGCSRRRHRRLAGYRKTVIV